MKQTELTYVTPKYPQQIRLDTTTACNASCKSCHRFLSTRTGQMPLSLVQKVLDDIQTWEIPLFEIVPVNYGEFFIRAEWRLILETIAHKLPRTQITIPTNGSLLHYSSVDALCSIPTVKIINFSINAYYDETYEAFMGLPAENLTNIARMISRIRTQRNDIKINASMVADPMYQSDYERDKFIQYWSPLVHQVWILSASSACRPDKTPMITRVTPCRSIFSDLVIGYDGKLSSCCWDSAFSMDLDWYTDSIYEAWHNPKLEALRALHNEHRRNEITLCKGCTSA